MGLIEGQLFGEWIQIWRLEYFENERQNISFCEKRFSTYLAGEVVHGPTVDGGREVLLIKINKKNCPVACLA